MKYTLLELTQSVLASIGGDEVNSTTDTAESLQVVEILRTVYDSIASRSNLPTHKTMFNLTASGVGSKPVLMTKPNTITDIEWIRYNVIKDGETDPTWADMKFMYLDQFMCMVQSLRPSETNVESFDHTVNGFTFTFNYRNDVGPTYYTTFDDNTVIFDSYDVAVDSTLQSNKTLCYGAVSNVFTVDDTWTPNLQAEQFSVLLNEAKAMAWAELKQSANSKAEQYARRGWTHIQASRHSIPKYLNTQGILVAPDFGRK